MELMQDNAPIHTANIIRNWLDEHSIPLVDWPPYSPVLNPIEHVWAKLKSVYICSIQSSNLFNGTKEQLKKQFYMATENA